MTVCRHCPLPESERVVKFVANVPRGRVLKSEKGLLLLIGLFLSATRARGTLATKTGVKA